MKNIFRKKHLLLLGVFTLLCLFLSATAPVCGQETPPPGSSGNQAAPAPDCDAVNLKISKHYFLNPDGSYRLRLYVKRRIMTYKGKKDYADFKFTYNSSHQSARLIRAGTLTADGRKVKVSEREVHDIPAPWNSEVSLYSRARQMVVNLPAVEPGSEIELEIELRDQIGFWCEEYFRLNEPIREKEVILTVPHGLDLKWKKPGGIEIEEDTDRDREGNTVYRWRATDVPALTPEKWAPDPIAEDVCLLASSFTSLSRVAAFYNRFFRARLSSVQASTGIPADRQDDDDKARELSQRIFRELRKASTPYIISFQETAFKLQAPEVTARNGYGTDADLALLFFDRLRRQGLKPRILMTGSKDDFLEFYADFPSPGWWKTTLIECRGEFFYFGLDKPAPGITGFDGCRALDLESGKLLTIRDREPARSESETIYRISAKHQVRGEFRLVLSGEMASGMRLRWRDLSPGEREIATSQMLHDLNPTAQATGPLKITGLRDDRRPLVMSGGFTIANLFATRDNRKELILPLNAPAFARPYQTLLTSRTRPVAIPENLVSSNRIVIKLPADLQPLRRPNNEGGELTRLGWKIESGYDPQTRTLTYSREIVQKRGLLKNSDPEYAAFLTAVRNLNRADNLGIVLEQLRGQPATAGNR